MTWTRETLRTDLLSVFREHVPTETSISESSHLVADLGIDSLGVMELIAAIEDKFHLTIADDALRNVDTVADVAKALEVKLKRDGRLEG